MNKIDNRYSLSKHYHKNNYELITVILKKMKDRKSLISIDYWEKLDWCLVDL